MKADNHSICIHDAINKVCLSNESSAPNSISSADSVILHLGKRYVFSLFAKDTEEWFGYGKLNVYFLFCENCFYSINSTH